MASDNPRLPARTSLHRTGAENLVDILRPELLFFDLVLGSTQPIRRLDPMVLVFKVSNH